MVWCERETGAFWKGKDKSHIHHWFPIRPLFSYFKTDSKNACLLPTNELVDRQTLITRSRVYRCCNVAVLQSCNDQTVITQHHFHIFHFPGSTSVDEVNVTPGCPVFLTSAWAMLSSTVYILPLSFICRPENDLFRRSVCSLTSRHQADGCDYGTEKNAIELAEAQYCWIC